ncbi:MAG: DUF2845 domain-containing protein [Prosthecobacter sp.]|nr:DUF2845 domain-containing protein [Prosthecobacter sp.]
MKCGGVAGSVIAHPITMMKLPHLSALSFTAVLLCQCASSESTAPASSGANPAPAAAASSAEPDTTLTPGMTQAQVIAKWGEPSSRQKTAQGEVWRYANQGWKRHVPYYGTFAHVEEHFLLFGPDGRFVKQDTKDFGNAFQEPWRRAFGTE